VPWTLPKTTDSAAEALGPSLAPPRSGDGAVLLERAIRAEREGHRAVARQLYEQVLWASPDTLNAERCSAALLGAARTYQSDGQTDAALDCLEAAQLVAEINGAHAALGAALNVRAVLEWHRGALDEAERLYVVAQQCAASSGDSRLVGMVAQNRGIIATVRGEFSTALDHYRTSLDAYRTLGNAPQLCGVLNNIGMVHTDLGQWEEAERAFREAIDSSVAAGDVVTRVLIDVNLAELAIAREDFGRARDICAASLRRARGMRDERAEAELLKQLGVVARETGHVDVAERHFDRADAIARERENVLLQAEIARERSEMLTRQGRFRETVQNLNRAHQLFARLRAQRDLHDIDRRTLRVEGTFLDVVRQWGESIESKDAYTQGHCVRVADLGCAVARRLGWDDRRLFWFRVGALLHDVGKIDIPREILNKPARLTSEEWALMRSHPEAGVELLRGIDFPDDVLPIVLSHHEKWDGTGYPHGLAADAIPLSARILGLADVYDALATDRSYKKGLPHKQAMEIMRSNVNTHFDPALFAEFEAAITDQHARWAA
jgi:putative nucleotidyltransferase with HDIG domain